MRIKSTLFGLLCVTSSWSASVYVNQAGFSISSPKIAVVNGSASLAGAPFTLKSGGSVVHTGTLSAAVNLTDWNAQPYFTADFTAFITPGTYTIEVSDNSSIATSYPFKIETNVYVSQALPKLMDYFLNDRADRADVWAKDAAIRKYGDNSGKTYNVQGGWYDAAGDVSKYLSHLSYANYLNPQQTPLTVWALAFLKERMPNLMTTIGLGTRAQAEALWGADFLMRMLDAEGYFYLTVFDKWTGIMDDREIAAFTGTDGIKSSKYQAAFREGAGMSIAALARVSTWGVSGDSSAAAYKAAAIRAYDHVKANNLSYCDNGAENIIDDYTALLAATELYNATKTESYIVDARARATSLVGRLHTEGYFYSDAAKTRPFWHASDAGLPLVALTRYLEVEPTNVSASIFPAIKSHLDYLLRVTNSAANPFGYARQTFRSQNTIQTGFFIPHDNESNYWWQGENARLASLATAAFYAGRMVYPNGTAANGLPDSLVRYGTRQLDWILGSNPYRMSFFQGIGSLNSKGYYKAEEKATQLVGGVANGITGTATNGTGIQYKATTDFGEEPWLSWRWEEQWLPHSTWFLMAIATMNDETPKAPASIKPVDQTRMNALAAFQVKSLPDGLDLRVLQRVQEDQKISVMDLHGRVLVRTMLPKGEAQLQIPMPNANSGVLLVRMGNVTRRVMR